MIRQTGGRWFGAISTRSSDFWIAMASASAVASTPSFLPSSSMTSTSLIRICWLMRGPRSWEGGRRGSGLPEIMNPLHRSGCTPRVLVGWAPGLGAGGGKVRKRPPHWQRLWARACNAPRASDATSDAKPLRALRSSPDTSSGLLATLAHGGDLPARPGYRLRIDGQGAGCPLAPVSQKPTVQGGFMHRALHPLALAIVAPLTVAPLAAQQFFPPPPAPPSNPVTANKTLLGMALFWEEQLSHTDSMACGTCHQFRFGGADGRAGI